MRLDLDGEAVIGAACPGELAAGAPAVREADPGGGNGERAVRARHRAGIRIGGRRQVHAAARIAEIGRAGGAVEAALLLVEAMREAAQFGDEMPVGAADLAEGADIEEQTLGGVL